MLVNLQQRNCYKILWRYWSWIVSMLWTTLMNLIITGTFLLSYELLDVFQGTVWSSIKSQTFSIFPPLRNKNWKFIGTTCRDNVIKNAKRRSPKMILTINVFTAFDVICMKGEIMQHVVRDKNVWNNAVIHVSLLWRAKVCDEQFFVTKFHCPIVNINFCFITTINFD